MPAVTVATVIVVVAAAVRVTAIVEIAKCYILYYTSYSIVTC